MEQTTEVSSRLRSIIERIERLNAEKHDISVTIGEVYAEAKGSGFDPKILRSLIRIRKMDVSDRNEQEELLSTYMHALGMQ